jgi:hypothetical protein
MLVVLSRSWPPLARCEHGRPRDERPLMRTSPPPRQRRDAAAFAPFVIPDDTPAYARRVLARLDRAVACEAVAMRDEPLSFNAPSPTLFGPTSAATGDKTIYATTPDRDARLLVAGRLHARADGATAFFLFHYLRLLAEQIAARAAGEPCPPQTWTMPDWSPAAPAARARVARDPRPRSTPSQAPRRSSLPLGAGNLIPSQALLENGS